MVTEPSGPIVNSRSAHMQIDWLLCHWPSMVAVVPPEKASKAAAVSAVTKLPWAAGITFSSVECS